jgi:hypothetical protein
MTTRIRNDLMAKQQWKRQLEKDLQNRVGRVQSAVDRSQVFILLSAVLSCLVAVLVNRWQNPRPTVTSDKVRLKIVYLEQKLETLEARMALLEQKWKAAFKERDQLLLSRSQFSAQEQQERLQPRLNELNTEMQELRSEKEGCIEERGTVRAQLAMEQQLLQACAEQEGRFLNRLPQKLMGAVARTGLLSIMLPPAQGGSANRPPAIMPPRLEEGSASAPPAEGADKR